MEIRPESASFCRQQRQMSEGKQYKSGAGRGWISHGVQPVSPGALRKAETDNVHGFCRGPTRPVTSVCAAPWGETTAISSPPVRLKQTVLCHSDDASCYRGLLFRVAVDRLLLGLHTRTYCLKYSAGKLQCDLLRSAHY